ncbi:hypothetical protein KHQ82_07940 [Mycoplasmatota bacterium]|nr:hypothetical protein KHQ82_07940 [Mycoplasmatota bacterium]
MRKYSKVSELTKQFLNGKLNKVLVEYENENTLLITVSYEDSHHSWLNYTLKVNNKSNSVDFVHHQCRDMVGVITLTREQEFESAICDYLVEEVRGMAC